MLEAPNEWGLIIPSVADGTRPGVGPGAVLTPGNNAYGSYVQMLAGASVTHDAFGIWINVNAGLVSSQARDTLVTLGIDPAGGTSYTTWIADLLASCATLRGGSSAGFCGGGIDFYLPVFLKAGTSIAAKASINNATVGTTRVQAKLFCKPSRPESFWSGAFVETFGAVTASSSGTPVTPGTTSEGDWAELGTLTRPIRWLEFGIGVNSAAMTANTYHVDIGIGDATSKRVVIQNAYVETVGVEGIIKPVGGAFCAGAIGDKIYGRCQVGPNAADTGVSLVAHGVG